MMNISSTSQRSTNQQSLHNTNSYTSYTYFHNKMCLANFGVKYPNPPSLVEGLGSLEFRWVASQTLRGFRNQCSNPKGFFQWPKGPPFAPNHYWYTFGVWDPDTLGSFQTRSRSATDLLPSLVGWRIKPYKTWQFIYTYVCHRRCKCRYRSNNRCKFFCGHCGCKILQVYEF